MRWYWILSIVVLSLGVLTGLIFLGLYLADDYRENKVVNVVLSDKIPESQPIEYSEPRGIATVAGGPLYGPLAVKLVDALDKVGSELPIEVWCLDHEESQHESIESLRDNPKVTINVLHDVDHVDGPRRYLGYQAKSQVLMKSRFKQVLVLDADNTPVSNPDPLFEQLKTAILWPDMSDFDEKPTYRIGSWFQIKAATGVRHPRIKSMESLFKKLGLDETQHRRQYESGQMLFDREECWNAIRRIAYINKQYQDTYDVFMGDKDTYSIGLDVERIPYETVRFRPGVSGYFNQDTQAWKGIAFIQRDPQSGDPMFAHVVGIPNKTEENTWTHVQMPTDGARIEPQLDAKTFTSLSHSWSDYELREFP